MRRVKITSIAVLLTLALCPGAKADTIWSDGFESGGNFPKWTSVNGNWTIITSALSAHSGNKGADIKGASGQNGDILSANISSAGLENIQWQYYYKVRDGLESADSVFAEWTVNGADWLPLAVYTNSPAGDWQFASFMLPTEANENPNLGFHLRAVLDSASDRMNFDDFVLSGTPVPEPASISIFASFLFSLSVCRLRKKS
jgi:hypothetical protein